MPHLPCPIQYWRNVLNYRLLLDTQGNGANQIEFKFLRVVLACLVVKTIEKGMREEKERHLHDYNGASLRLFPPFFLALFSPSSMLL